MLLESSLALCCCTLAVGRYPQQSEVLHHQLQTWWQFSSWAVTVALSVLASTSLGPRATQNDSIRYQPTVTVMQIVT